MKLRILIFLFCLAIGTIIAGYFGCERVYVGGEWQCEVYCGKVIK